MLDDIIFLNVCWLDLGRHKLVVWVPLISIFSSFFFKSHTDLKVWEDHNGPQENELGMYKNKAMYIMGLVDNHRQEKSTNL